MVLSDVDIKRYIAEGKIKITPELPPEQFGSCSVDFRLGNEFSVFEYSRHPYIDLKNRGSLQDIMRKVEVPDGEPFVLQPRDFVLAITEETLDLGNDVLGRLEGRSSLGRIGIIVHGTAGLFDPGWIGKATLELSNLSRMAVALYPGMRVCSFTFEQVSTPVSVSYRDKPNNSTPAKPARSLASWCPKSADAGRLLVWRGSRDFPGARLGDRNLVHFQSCA
jgi:dCTP deaminase